MTEIRFNDLPLSDPLLSALEAMGYEHPTPVQATAIPLATAGRDLMVQSQTGTGKTAAFGIPLLESLRPENKIQALVLCPTRELARQVADEFSRLGQFKAVNPVAVYGGASIEKQIAELKFAQVVVGTPGRVLDHLKRGTARFNGVQTLVLDEADEMLSMGFAQELEQIMRYVPSERQTLLFSATIPPDIKRYGSRYMNEPEFLSLIEENVAADDVEHQYYMVSGVGRSRDLVRVIRYENPESAIIFTNTKVDTEVVARALQREGLQAEYLNGDLPQRQRERVLGLMKDHAVQFLVATDIAARGIDISQLSHVINYQLPESAEVYIHRTGRTGRAGASGTAISLIGPREIGVYYYLKRIYKVSLQEKTVPSKTEVELRRAEQDTAQLVQKILSSLNPEQVSETVKAQAALLLEQEKAVELVQILLSHFTSGSQSSGRSRPSVGGVLADVPEPKKVAPGSRKPTLAGIADRVATIRGEYRGLPGTGASDAGAKQADATPAEATPPPKPKRTPRRRKGADAQAESADTQAETLAEQATPVTPEEPEEAAPARPKRKPRRRKSAEQTSSQATEEIPSQGETGAATSADESARPKRQSRRRKTKKVEETPIPTADVNESGPNVDESSRPKRQRRRRKTETAEHAATSSAEVTEAGTSADETARPRRKSRRRKAKDIEESGTNTAAEDAQESAPADQPSPTGIGSEEERPKRRSRRRRTAREETTDNVAVTDVDEETSSSASMEDEGSRGRAPVIVPDGKTRLFLNIGFRNRVTSEGLGDTLAELGGLFPEDFSDISVHARHSFVTVEDEFVDDLVDAVNGESFKGRTLRIETAKPN